MHALVQSRTFERQLYLGSSLLFLALVFWTFAHSYYLRFLFSAAPLSTLLHVHGVVMSGWVILLAVQSGLIAAHRARWHRRLGTIGAVWALLVVILGSVTTLHAAAREVRAHSDMAPMQLTITALEIVQMVLFSGFVLAALLMRRRPDYHKRLMLLTIACMLPSALGRLPVSFMNNDWLLLGINLFVVACVGLDSLRFKRLHPAFGWGAVAFLLVMNSAFYFANLPAWRALGSRLVS
ncbi:MAG TPA: hypothetical protein VGL55_14010 [Steroidobacteraceae bacterium]|jgi:hypothetical protein